MHTSARNQHKSSAKLEPESILCYNVHIIFEDSFHTPIEEFKILFWLKIIVQILKKFGDYLDL